MEELHEIWIRQMNGTHWKDAYGFVEARARALLENRADKSPLSSSGLVEALFPGTAMRGPASTEARQRIFRALTALAVRGLSDCATRGEPVTKDGLTKRPWMWHSPSSPNAESKVRAQVKRDVYVVTWETWGIGGGEQSRIVVFTPEDALHLEALIKRVSGAKFISCVSMPMGEAVKS